MSARRASPGDATAHGDEHGGPNAAERCVSALLDGVPPGEEPTERAVVISQEKQQDRQDFAEWVLRLRGRTMHGNRCSGNSLCLQVGSNL